MKKSSFSSGFSSGFSRFPDQPDPEIWKFLQIPNRLAKTVNLIYYLQKVKKSGFSGFPDFPDQPDLEIRKFLQIPNGLAKTVNLIYYLQKVIFGAPDGPDPPDGAGAGVGGQGEVGSPSGRHQEVQTKP